MSGRDIGLRMYLRADPMEFCGEFETHITVSFSTSEGIGALQQWGVDHGLKCLHIILERGVSASQPMLTRRGRGNLTGELGKALGLSRSLQAEGFPVTRVKIEAALWNQDIPQSNLEAQEHPSERYFEHHIKLLLKPQADIPALVELSERHSAHLSRNALRIRNDECHERFITQRCLSAGRAEARQRLDHLMEGIVLLGHPVVEVEEEYVVYDDNLAIDAGWIRSEE